MMIRERYLLLTRAIDESIDNLRSIRERFADDPDMLAVYESSSLFALGGLKQELSDLLNENKELADLMVRLKGDAFDEGRAPARIIADFLQNLTVATQQAFRILYRINTEKGRPPRHIQELAQFELAGISKGSFVLELQKSLQVKEIDLELGDTENDQLFDQETIYKAMDEMLYGQQEDEEYMDGILLLMKALRGTESDVDFLKEQVGDNTLTLLHHAKKLTPSQSSIVDEIEFDGHCIRKLGIEQGMVVNFGTRKNINDIIEKLSTEQRIVEGYGWLRKADMDTNKGILRNVMLGEIELEELPYTIIFDEDDSNITARAFGELVEFKGLLTYSKTHEPHHIELFGSDLRIIGKALID